MYVEDGYTKGYRKYKREITQAYETHGHLLNCNGATMTIKHCMNLNA